MKLWERILWCVVIWAIIFTAVAVVTRLNSGAWW